MCHAARLTAAVEPAGLRFDVISNAIQNLVDTQQHLQQQPAYRDDQFLENGLKGGLSMPKGPRTQQMRPVRPVNANNSVLPRCVCNFNS